MYIKVKELEKILKEEFKEQLLIKITGMINVEIKIENIKISINREKLWLMNKNKEKIGINKHQIIAIDNDNKNSIIKIKLDYLLDIYLIKA